MKCPKCQFENPDDTIYCGKCAAPLRISGEPSVSPTETLKAPKEKLDTGSTFAGRYQIIEELGKGGMGKVYKVLDKEIKEKIALKLLNTEISTDKETIDRFRNELKFARKISHKNVCRMYDLSKEKETHYITMEYVPGEDLKSMIRMVGQLSSGKTTFIARQICEGLVEAHRLGVVHRDLKPQNIMIDREGNARIMDFGIARSLKTKGITDTGLIIGTPEYMSPEQVEGKETDQRSDIYSLGIIIYEMVTGRVPFEGNTPLSIAMKHKTEAPRDPKEFNAQIPEGLKHLILRCMEKVKEKRYQSIEEVLSELNSIQEGIPTTDRAVPEKKPETERGIWKDSIAVLPFSDLSPAKDQEYFCDGMTDAIIGKLSQFEKLKVISRTSVMRYKEAAKDIKEIGQELGVATILEGTIQKENNRIRVRAQLINVEDGFHLWTETYDRKLESVFDMQDEISKAIVSKLKIKLVSEEKALLKKRYTDNVEAYNLYLKGRHFWNKRTEQGLKKAIEYFEQALQLDPNYALAYAGQADSYNMLGGYIILPPKEAFSKAKSAATKALEIDEELAEAHASLACAMAYYDYDWAGAESEYKRALELNPNYATAHQWYGILLRDTGRLEEGLAEIKKAKELDPLSLPINTDLGEFFYFARQYDQAIEQCKKSLEIDSKFHWAYAKLATAYLQKNFFEEAIKAFQKAVTLSGGSSEYLAGLAHAYAVAGYRDKALKILEEFREQSRQEPVLSYQMALIFTGLGDKDQALEWLEKAYEERSPLLTYLKGDPVFDGLRSEPKFIALLKKMDFEK